MSFRITEDYVQAALALERAGYEWQPGPGDWILDRDDHSIGMLTTPVKDAGLVRRLNTHLPTHAQVNEMMAAVGIELRLASRAEFTRGEDVLCSFDAAEYEKDAALCRVKALAAFYAAVTP